jgi:hypothetical protein
MLVYEAYRRHIQSSISRTKVWNVIPVKNFVKNYGHIGFIELYTIEVLEFSV